ncbi:thiol peroxidase [Namhaeicola litoreus]|uniref:Thiol peroxidase n=1 Tax=Namhaeicola litoreus TaxID=1052145 RepID=A0ABW3Y4V4_9FLAO
MTKITLKGNETKTIGKLPKVGKKAPDFKLIKNDLTKASLKDFKGSKILLNITPSLDTGVCATSLRKFNEAAAAIENAVIINVSRDLPFAQARFCGAEGIEKAITLSDFKSGKFGKKYGVTIKTGPLKGLHSRAVVVVDEKGKVSYTEQVPEITQEPNYEAALAALK